MVMIKNIKLKLHRAIILQVYACKYKGKYSLAHDQAREIILENRGNATFQPARDTDPDVNND
jgi:hypothetical protein